MLSESPPKPPDRARNHAWHLSCAGAQDGLLDWVQPRTEEHYDVVNFTTSWKDGIALLALYDNICPGEIDMEEIKNNEARPYPPRRLVRLTRLLATIATCAARNAT